MSGPQQTPAQTTLPSTRGALLGRDADILAVIDLLRREEVQLVTLLGPGGVGKTRLALEVARNYQQLASAIQFVTLESVREPHLVLPEIARAFAIRHDPDKPLLAAIQTKINESGQSLVLDNLEHVIDSAAQIGDVIAGCPNLKVLVTSRVMLRLSMEHVFLVTPLDLIKSRSPSATDVLESASGRLFVIRSQLVKPGFEITDSNASDVAEICRRLDGLPLAIELAAQRSNVLTPSALRDRLDSLLPLLTTGPRDKQARHQTLRQTIAWSCDLLSEDVRRLFRRLAVFEGGFELEAVDAIAQIEPTTNVLAGISSLVEASLLQPVDGSNDQARFRMLETIREFGFELMDKADEVGRVRDAHAAYFLALAEQAFPEWCGERTGYWHARFVANLGNVRAACARFLEIHDAKSGIRLVTSLDLLWEEPGLYQEAFDTVERLLELDGEISPQFRASALSHAGWLAMRLQNHQVASAYADEAILLARESDDSETVIVALFLCSAMEFERGNYAESDNILEEVLSLARANHRTWRTSAALHNLGISAFVQGEMGRARVLHEESIAIDREASNTFSLASNLGDLGMIVLEQGDSDTAIQLFEEQIELAQQHGLDITGVGFALVAARSGASELAARLYGACEAAAERIGSTQLDSDDYFPIHEQAILTLRASLGVKRFESEWSTGREESVTVALAPVLALIRSRRDKEKAIARPVPNSEFGLSSRELDVLRLVAKGQSNREIAELLFISVPTVKVHVHSILSKLGLESRTAAAAFAIHNGF